MESFATPYPVIFHDGERDHDKGHIGVHSVLTFKRFQSLLSQKVGFPASQLSATFVCRRTGKTADNKRQKLPINDNTNFNIILNQHNPMWEKDCHFLVSMKKSKKERKGTRRRNVDAENGEEEDSGSSRGDVSPLREREKGCGSTDDEPTTQVNSVTRAMAESVTSLPNELASSMHELHLPHTVSNAQHLDMVNQRLVNTFPDGRPNGEKILLRRDQSLSRSLAPTVHNRSHISFSMDSSTAQSSTSNHPETLKKEYPIGQNERIDCKETRRLDSNSMLRQPGVVPSTSEGCQDRYHDVVWARSAALLQRTGVCTGTPISSFTAKEAVRSHAYTSTGALLLSRVSHGLTSGTTAALQQAQAHYLNIQAQHSEQMQLNSQALSKMRGVVRDFAACENGGHAPLGICQYCCNFRELNVNPTPFHLCVHDRITNGFRGPSPAGPIERPAKRVEAAA